MTKLVSKEAKRLARLKFTEQPPRQIQHTPMEKLWARYLVTIDRDDLEVILSAPEFEYISVADDSIGVFYKRTETAEECRERIDKQQAEWDAYELRKTMFYADVTKRIHEAEELEKVRRERFADPDYIELLRLKKKFGEL